LSFGCGMPRPAALADELRARARWMRSTATAARGRRSTVVAPGVLLATSAAAPETGIHHRRALLSLALLPPLLWPLARRRSPTLEVHRCHCALPSHAFDAAPSMPTSLRRRQARGEHPRRDRRSCDLARSGDLCQRRALGAACSRRRPCLAQPVLAGDASWQAAAKERLAVHQGPAVSALGKN
jgi:hypothetical protein